MRRLLAIFVLCVLAWPFAAPLALGATGANVPSCCRTSGKHHCMSAMPGMLSMAGTRVASSSLPPSVRTSSCCPLRSPMVAPAGAAQQTGLPTSALPYYQARLVAAPHSAVLALLAADGNPQRGPPSYFA